jgi:hypothetical protein
VELTKKKEEKEMKVIKILAVLLALSLLLTGCGGASNGAVAGSTAVDKGYDMMAPETEGLHKDTATTQTALPVNQKLIRKIWLEAETEDMDTLLSSVEDRIAQLEGYVEARQIRNGSAYSGRRYRYAELTIRIPAEKLNGFVEEVSKQSNITSTRETTDDVTLSYVELDSKVTALETEQTRLLELLAQAATMDDILMIESRLTDVRSQLEEIKSKLRVYDNLVSYGTVYLNVTEVTEFTPVTEPETMWQRMSAGIKDSWKDMVQGLENTLVFFVVALPHLLPWAVVAAAVIALLLTRRKKKTKKTPPPPAEET